jgi:glyoxylase-like metal-dependent hydrolase (beta-lactamase superfamily II)
MMLEVKTICLTLPLRVNTVNCFLLRTEVGWILIDTACSNKRAELLCQMESAGCEPGKLKLILLTHGDFDHCGNARYLKARFASKIAMHRDDRGMVERGDMYWNRGKSNLLVRALAPALFRFRTSDRFSPDLYVEDGYDLAEYGARLKVVHLPGHSRGSIGILAEEGVLFCGDLLINEDKPVLNHRIADPVAARESVERLKRLNVKSILPSHGKQFRMEDLA